MRFAIVIHFFVCLYVGQAQKAIQGVVTEDTTPLKNVKVVVQGSDRMVLTDEIGAYKILASPRDVLEFTFLGMQTVEIIVEDVTNILNIKMVPQYEELDEAVVVKRKEKSQRDLAQEYNLNRNLIKTGFGILDKETASFSMVMVDGSELAQGSVDFIQAVQFKFPGIRVIRPPEDPTRPIVFMRSTGSINNSSPLIFEVDGNVVGDAPTYLDVASIERIAILPSLISAARYGTGASGGVMVINTKLSKNSIDPETNKPYDYALIQNNRYEESALTAEEVYKNAPSYVLELRATTTVLEAQSVYAKYKDSYEGFVYFHLDGIHHFIKAFNEFSVAEKILKDNATLFDKDPVALKAVAYIYQEVGHWNEANEIYKQVLKLRPGYAQSYLDLANSYRDLKNYEKALAIFARYDYLLAEKLLKNDDEIFAALMDKEQNNLLLMHGKEVFSNREIESMGDKEQEKGITRLVFEWNDSEAEFDLQFVNPEKRFFVWKHNQTEIPERIKAEKLVGFSSEEYILDNSLNGLWQVNVLYQGNKRKLPTYLKASIYHDYGTLRQRKETKVMKLFLEGINQKFFTSNKSAKLIAD